MEVLKWLMMNGGPWDEYTAWAAASEGRLEVLMRLRENECEWDASFCEGAAA